ncbi:MAG: hypothetical protein ACT4QF_12520 [Sporichthyaceae bacterium]
MSTLAARPAAPHVAAPTGEVSKAPTRLWALLTLSAFGPYVVLGMRTEQLSAYGIAFFAILGVPWLWRRPASNPRTTMLMALWGTYAGVALLGAVASIVEPVDIEPGPLFSGLDNMFLPLAVMTVVLLYGRSEWRRDLIRTLCTVLVWAAMANSILSLVCIKFDLSSVLRVFWLSSYSPTVKAPGGESVAEQAALLGRFTGVFSQPAEAGLMYGLAGLAALYVYRNRSARLYLSLIVIFLGGMVSVSKVFLLVGAPILLFLIVRRRGGGMAVMWTGVVGFVALANVPLFANWSGMEHVTGLFRLQENNTFIGQYTGGRFGGGGSGSLGTAVEQVMDTSPVIGFGAGGLANFAYDNGWIEALVLGGLTGVIVYTLVLVFFVHGTLGLKGPEGTLARWSAVLVAAGSLGLPALTANRVGLLVWLLLATLLIPEPAQAGAAAEDDGSADAAAAIPGPRTPVG